MSYSLVRISHTKLKNFRLGRVLTNQSGETPLGLTVRFALNSGAKADILDGSPTEE